MEILINLTIVILTFFFMELVAWFTHKYVMHGFLWFLHEDHHVQSPGFFQKNDAFFLIFALPSWLFMMFGAMNGFNYMFFIGTGILLYGIAYFLVHEVLIHKRLKKLRKFLFKNADNSRYLKVLLKAHHMHHKHITKEDGESFGMLIVSKKYFDMVK
jgi:beta-carotene 3-hydroxylase